MIRLLLTSTTLTALLTAGALAQAPANNTMAPANNTMAPAGNTMAPANNAMAPAGNTMAPANNAMAPAGNTMAPAGNTMAPAGNTMAPANNAMAPADNTMAPAGNTMAPANNTMAPVGNTMAPANDMVTTTTTMDNSMSMRTPMVMSQGYSVMDGDHLASRIMGSTVYTSNADDADTIGDVNDLVIGDDGEISAVVIGVGGFLGMGEKNVAVDFTELEWSQAADGTFRYVLPTTADQLNTAPEFVFTDENDIANNAALNGNPAPIDTMTPANTMTPVNTTSDVAAPFDRSAMTPVDVSAMTSDDLKGTAVYGLNDEQIGDIGDFVLNSQGGIDAVVVDVGGFLGLGQKPVAVGFDNLQFSMDANNNRYLFMNTTKEQLEAQPAFNKDTYATERDTQRMMMTR